jgi:hypothetical protein
MGPNMEPIDTQAWVQLTHENALLWLPWLPILTLHGPTLTGAGFASQKLERQY